MRDVSVRLNSRRDQRNPDGHSPPAAAWSLAALLVSSGALHFVKPAPFESIVPGFLGDPGPWVAVSGVAELACAATLLPRRTRRPAGWACAALFVAVFPANITMAVQSLQPPRHAGAVWIAWLRLPLQVPLVVWALWVAGAIRRGGRRTGRPPRGSAAA